MNELFAKLKRLFEPRPRPAETIGEPTADRPPPPVAEPPRARYLPRAEPPRAEPPPVEAAPSLRNRLRFKSTVPSRLPAVDDLAEVRAALEAVAEAPVKAMSLKQKPDATDEPEAEVHPRVHRASTAASTPPPAPTLLPPATEEAVDAPAPVGGRVGDALVLTLGTPPTTFTVAKTSATLGRGQENTIRLDDLSVSRRHARIAYRQGGYWLSDLGSMGGTWVGRNATERAAPDRLRRGDRHRTLPAHGQLRRRCREGTETKKSASKRGRKSPVRCAPPVAIICARRSRPEAEQAVRHTHAAPDHARPLAEDLAAARIHGGGGGGAVLSGGLFHEESGMGPR